jgi:hypothetical protein
MSKRRLAPFAFAVMVAFVPPAVAETTSSVKAGVLTCKLAPSIGFIVGSQQSMSCRYTPNAPHLPETYTGTMDTIGLDIGVTAGGGLAWAVFAPTEGPPPGALAGLYVGASGDASFGVGGGPMFWSAARRAQSPCNRFPWKARWVSTSPWGSRVSRSHGRDEACSDKSTGEV